MKNKKLIVAASLGGALFLSLFFTANTSGLTQHHKTDNSKILNKYSKKNINKVSKLKVNEFKSEGSKVINTLQEPSWYKQAGYSFAGVEQDRQDLGMIVKAGGTLRIRQVNSNYSGNLSLRMYGKDRNDESITNVGKDWVEVKAGTDLVPFIDTPWDTSEGKPEVEYQIDEKEAEELDVFKNGDNEKDFFDKWRESEAPYALFQSKSIQILTPYKDLNEAQNANADNKNGISNYLTKYDGIVAADEHDTGLDDSEPWNEKSNTRIFVKEDDRGNPGGSTAFSNPNYIGNEGGVSLFFTEFWPHLEHEVGHEYQLGVGEDALGNNGGLVTTEITNEVVLGFRYMKDRDYFWDDYTGPSNAETKDIAEANMYQSLIKEGKKYSDLQPGSEQIILMALMFQRAGAQSSIPFYQGARKLLYSPDFSKDNQTFSSYLQKAFSQIGSVNYTPLLEKLGASTDKSVENEIINKKYPAIAMLADVVPESKLADARKILDPKYLVDSNFMMISNDEISALGLKGSLKVDLTDFNIKDGQAYVLKNGDTIVADTKAKNSILNFKDVPNGVYQLEKEDGSNISSDTAYVYIKDPENDIKIEGLGTNLDVENDHLLYEKNESVDEKKFLEDAGVSTQSSNTITSNFEKDVTSQLGDHIIQVTATNSKTGEKLSKNVTLSVIDQSATLEGALGFTDSSGMEVNKPKELELKISGKSLNQANIRDIKLTHKFNSDILSLENNIQQKLPGETWETQTIDSKNELILNVDQIKPQDEYAVKYNILASNAISLSKGDQWEVQYSYDNELNGTKKTYTKTLDLSVDIDVENSTDNGGATNISKKGMITFRKDNNPSYPVDPEDPETTVVPQEPVNPNGAELMIIYASNLNFGKQSKNELKWNALTDKIKDEGSSGQFRNVVPFVSVKDSRGTDRNGWKLEVTKDDEFKDDGGNILKGATLTYSDLHYSGQSNVPDATSGDIQINRDATVIASANNTQGSGITSLALGNIKKETADQTSGVTLNVLHGTIINSKSYTTSITYELVAGV